MMDDIFGKVDSNVDDVGSLLIELRNLYLNSLRERLVSGELGIDDLLKLGKFFLPQPDVLYRGLLSGGDGNSRDIRQVLKVVGE